MRPEGPSRPFTPFPLPPPTLADGSAARRVLAGHLAPTPLVRFHGQPRPVGSLRGARPRHPGHRRAAASGGGGGCAPLAAALRLREQLAGKTVCLILSGSNIPLDALRRLLRDGEG